MTNSMYNCYHNSNNLSNLKQLQHTEAI